MHVCNRAQKWWFAGIPPEKAAGRAQGKKVYIATLCTFLPCRLGDSDYVGRLIWRDYRLPPRPPHSRRDRHSQICRRAGGRPRTDLLRFCVSVVPARDGDPAKRPSDGRRGRDGCAELGAIASQTDGQVHTRRHLPRWRFLLRCLLFSSAIVFKYRFRPDTSQAGNSRSG